MLFFCLSGLKLEANSSRITTGMWHYLKKKQVISLTSSEMNLWKSISPHLTLINLLMVLPFCLSLELWSETWSTCTSSSQNNLRWNSPSQWQHLQMGGEGLRHCLKLSTRHIVDSFLMSEVSSPSWFPQDAVWFPEWSPYPQAAHSNWQFLTDKLLPTPLYVLLSVPFPPLLHYLLPYSL